MNKYMYKHVYPYAKIYKHVHIHLYVYPGKDTEPCLRFPLEEEMKMLVFAKALNDFSRT